MLSRSTSLAVESLIENKDSTLADCAAYGLSNTLLVYDSFNDVIELAESNSFAKLLGD